MILDGQLSSALASADALPVFATGTPPPIEGSNIGVGGPVVEGIIITGSDAGTAISITGNIQDVET